MATDVIALIGKKRSGKDTFANVLVEERGYTRVAFADPLRSAALELDPWVPIHGSLARLRKTTPGLQASTIVRLSALIEAVGWETAKDLVPEVRRLLQRFGTESIRKIEPDFWINAARKTIDAIDGPVVITDCRYPNEADFAESVGGVLVRIVRPGTESDDAHPSETALDDRKVDVVIRNDGSIEDLRQYASEVADVMEASSFATL
jgi:hypothetical protein